MTTLANVVGFLAQAQQTGSSGSRLFDHLWPSLIAVCAFGLVGIAMTILGFKVFDWLLPHVKVEKELCERNYAVAIVMAAGILGVSIVIAAAIMG